MEVGNQALFVIHGLKRRRRIGLRQIFQQRAGGAYRAFHLPERVAAVKLSSEYPVPSTQ